MIEVQNVSKTYPTGIRANHSISFTVKQGEIVALVGPNGSGKTTLMQQMLGVLKIGEGSIRIDGAENNTQNIAYIPQTPAIYPALTVRESLLATTKYLGVPQKEAAERIDRVLEKQGCHAMPGSPPIPYRAVSKSSYPLVVCWYRRRRTSSWMR